MKLHPSQPVTILADRVDRRYIPNLANFPDGTLRLDIGIGTDSNFTPSFPYQSYDGGKTWAEAPRVCPRLESNAVLSDGSYFETDSYWFQDPDEPEWFWGNGGFSSDGRTFTHQYIRMHCTSFGTTTLRKLREVGVPHDPWSELINHANHHRPVDLDSVIMGGGSLTSVIELDTPKHLLAVGYNHIGDGKKHAVALFESNDAGRTWQERNIIMAPGDTPEGANETALVRLDNGELYAMVRTGGLMLQSRSADLGQTWSTPGPVRLDDTGEYITGVWPIIRKLRQGGLACTFGRPKSMFTSLEEAANCDYASEGWGRSGKLVMIDPTGTGRHWQDRIALHELEVAAQERNGVPPNQRLRVSENSPSPANNSWEYLSLNEVAEDVLLVTYDVQNFRENWNSHPVNGVRMVRIEVQR